MGRVGGRDKMEGNKDKDKSSARAVRQRRQCRAKLVKTEAFKVGRVGGKREGDGGERKPLFGSW